MHLLVKDITDLNPNTQFRSDVQISSYRSELNYELAKSYMFTTGDFPGKKASIELLDILMRASLEELENRILIQATYGHGKSHFGIALANFFGKANGSPESNVLLENIGHTLNNPSRLEHFRLFKNHQKPRLVVILRGDTPGNLRDKFFRGLDEALRDHDELKNVRPPFWFGEALRFVSGLEGDKRDKANAFLEQYRLDVQGLREELEERRSEHYQLCVDLFRHVVGFLPNFGGQTSLTEAIDWAITELCADDKPFGGLLILFDEFSVFVRTYVATESTGVPFQELMNGIANHRGKVLFVAFAQHEPEQIIKRDGSASSEELVKELNRLPTQARYQLHSSLEDVLRAYFKLDEACWQQFMKQPKVGRKVAEASDVAYGAFEARYRRLGWSTEEFQERVAKSCFPLHPLTTVLLSSLELEAAATTRSVLGFLKDEEGALKPLLEQPAATENAPNWVLPIRLVDYFEEMLGERAWAQYSNVDVPDLTDMQRDVLKGMVLQLAGKIETTRKFGPSGYSLLIAQLNGHEPHEVAETLRVLEEQRYIRYDAANRIYAFWAGSNAALELERMLNEEIANRDQHNRMGVFLEEPDHQGSTKVNELLGNSRDPISKTYPVSIDWGHQDDWIAQEVVLTRKSFTPHTLTQLTGMYHASVETYPSCRGLVIIPIATTQEDVYWYRENIEPTLDTLAHLKSAPLLALSPNTPTPELPKLLIKYALLNENVFSDKAIREIGRQVFGDEKERYVDQINKLLQQLRSESDAKAPRDARGRVNAVATSTRAADRVERLLREVYAITYSKGVGTFFTQYRHMGTARLREAVSNLVPILATNNLSNARAGLADVAKDIVDRFIERDWGLLSAQSQLQLPTSPKAQVGWNIFDAAFPAGETASIKRTFDTLLNLPYGYDYNTLILLFACWYGYNRRDVELILDRRLIALNDEFLASGRRGSKLRPSELVQRLGQADLRRRDRGKVLKEVQEIVDKVERGGLNRADAESDVSKLRSFISRFGNLDEALTADAELALRKINEGLHLVQGYDRRVNGIQEALERSSDIGEIARLLTQVSDLDAPITVKSSAPSPDELRSSVINKLEERTTTLCTRYASLSKITDYGAHESQLNAIHREVNQLGLNELSAKVEEAKTQLLQAKQQLEAKQHEEHELELINTLSDSAGLSELIQNKQTLERLMSQGSEKVQEKARAKLKAIGAEIERLQKFVVTLPQKLDAVQDVASVRRIMKAILVERSRYQNHPDLKDIEHDQARCEQLEQFFQILQANKHPASPAEAEVRAQELRELPTKFDGYLSENQRNIAEEALRNLQHYISAQEAKATSWLESLAEKFAGNHDLKQIEGELNRPHPFLAEQHQQQLRELKQQLAEKLNAELEEERMLETIKRIPETGSLVQLQEALDSLTAYSSSVPSIERSVQQKRKNIETAVHRLKDRLATWQQRLEEIQDISQATKLHTEILKQIERYSGSELQGEVEALLAKAEATTERWRADQVAQQRVRLMPTPSTFEQVREQRQALNELEDQVLSDALKRALTKRREELKAHEERMLAALEEQAKRLQQATSASAARKVESELNKLETFFAGTEVEARVGSELERAEKLARYLGSLSHYTDVNLETPNDMTEHLNSVRALGETFAAYLDTAQKQFTREIIAKIEQAGASKRKEAREWLEQRKVVFEGARNPQQLEELEQQLKSPHPFLSSDDAAELKVLTVAVWQKIDENEVHSVISRFKNIKNLEKRRTCLQQLQSLMQEQLA